MYISKKAYFGDKKMENVATPQTKIALANIANQMALSLDAITAAKKEWFPAALALLPVIYKPELLKKLGYNQGATAYFKDQSNALGLKQTTLANIKNTFQKVITFKKHFEHVDIKNVNVSILTNLFNKAKAKNPNGKLTETNVKNQIKAAISEGLLSKTDINYVEDIDQQIAFTKAIKITELDKDDSNFEIILDALDKGVAPSAQPSKKTTKSDNAPSEEKPEITNSKTATKEVKKEETTTKPVTQTEPLNEAVVEKEALVTPDKVEPEKTTSSAPESTQTPTISTDELTNENTQEQTKEQTGSAIVDHFRELSMADKELIGSVAAAMVGDKTEALLLSLPANKQALIIEMIKRIK